MSRADTTLDDWVGVSDDTKTDTDDKSQEPVSASCWQPETPQCQCGASLTNWHSEAGARRMVRVYGDDEASTVPGCPECVDWGHADDNNRQNVDTVAHAIKEMKPTSSIQRRSRREVAVREVVRDE